MTTIGAATSALLSQCTPIDKTKASAAQAAAQQPTAAIFNCDIKAMQKAEDERATTLAADQKALDAGAKTNADTQLLGQGQSATGDSAVDKFTKFMDAAKDGIGSFMRAQILASKGLTEEDVAKMDADTRDKLEAEIRDEIQKKIEEARAKQKDEDLSAA